VSTQRVLEMDFSTELNKTHRIKVNDAKDPLTGAEVGTAMDNIVSKNIFSGTGGEITGKIGARLVVTDKSDIELV